MNQRKGGRSSSRPRRLYVPDIKRELEEIPLDREQTHYVRDVLRLGHGDKLTLFDGSGWDYPATVSSVSSHCFRLRVSEPQAGLPEPPVRLALGVGLLKAQKMDLVVQKAVELGVNEVFPVTSQRAVRTLDKERSGERRDRWERIAREASRQCGRSQVPVIHSVATLEEALDRALQVDLRLLFSVRDARPLDSIRRISPASPEQIFALTGPEGGFSPEEEKQALEAGFLSVKAGPRTLRAETAAILAAGLIQYTFGDLGGQGVPEDT